ncbi:MAG: hypothetical protein KBS35_02630 [Mycoplasma sp.]|nr:hypothetical protein [Candidatus Hennigella equi]
MANSTSTYAKMAKWLKWSSLFILLIPVAQFIMGIVNYVKPITAFDYAKVNGILNIIILALSVIWIILNVILFLTAGTVKNKTSPAMIRIGLIISFALVLAPIIVGLLMSYPKANPIIPEGDIANWLWIFMPLIVTIGYIAGFSCASRAQHHTM